MPPIDKDTSVHQKSVPGVRSFHLSHFGCLNYSHLIRQPQFYPIMLTTKNNSTKDRGAIQKVDGLGSER